mgnify:CR=1 FL=1
MAIGVKNLKVAETKNNTNYYSFDAYIDGKKTSAKIWNITDCKIKSGDIIDGNIKEDEYKGKKQFIISNYSLIEDIDDKDREIIFGTPQINAQAIYDSFIDLSNEMENKQYSTIINRILCKYKNEFMTAPAAAGVHQAYKSGLIKHTENVLNLVKMFSVVYNINRDLAYTSSILHDIGKIFTYELEDDNI